MVSATESLGEGQATSSWAERMVRLDLATWVLIIHGTALVTAGDLLHPTWAAGLIGLFGLWRIGFQVALNRARVDAVAGLTLVKASGSLLLASAVIAADGGSESPFFFWTLLLLAYNALITSASHLLVLSGVAVAGYVGVMAAIPEVTARSLGRLGLLVSFCAVVQVGRVRLEHHRRAAERADQDRKRFLMTASHQIRTPLTPIIAYAEMLQSDDLAVEDQLAAAREILAAGREMERLFERMASVVSLRTPEADASAAVPVAAVLEHIRNDIPTLLDGVVCSGDQRAVLKCRPESVASALYELLDNGHRLGRPPVRLSWARVARHIEFAISDAGKGPEEHLTNEQLFGFWGAGASQDVMPADGHANLGLLRARLLAELDGGTLGLFRGREQWAFVLRLPAGRA